MDWIMIAIVSGSLLTSTHPTEEACRGRAAMVEKEQKVKAECVQAPSKSSGLVYSGTGQSGGGLAIVPNGNICLMNNGGPC